VTIVHGHPVHVWRSRRSGAGKAAMLRIKRLMDRTPTRLFEVTRGRLAIHLLESPDGSSWLYGGDLHYAAVDKPRVYARCYRGNRRNGYWSLYLSSEPKQDPPAWMMSGRLPHRNMRTRIAMGREYVGIV